MGLAAAKGIVQNHNGCISVVSEADETTFQVFLPREVSDAEIVLGDRKSSSDIFGLKVLVVDDEPQVLSIIKSLLDHHGCNVLSADKGQEALDVIERHKADLDLVILDIQMPDMTGDKVYTRLKEIKPDLKVLISSGHEEFTALKNIMLDPRDKFLKKPFRMTDLMLKIKELTVSE
jgi:two-component system cell cycle sensor histidine kinase/response regulator CckA